MQQPNDRPPSVFPRRVRAWLYVGADDTSPRSTRIRNTIGVGEQHCDFGREFRRLVRALNTQGATWSLPRAGDVDVDAVSRGERDELLQMQVVRVPADQGYWRQLSKTESAERTTPITGAAALRMATEAR